MAENGKLLSLVQELIRLQQRVIEVQGLIAKEAAVKPVPKSPSLVRMVYLALKEGDKGIGDITRHILHAGYRHQDKKKELSLVVQEALARLKSVGAIKKQEESRIYSAGELGVNEVMEKLRAKLYSETLKTEVIAKPTPSTEPPLVVPKRRGRPPGSKSKPKIPTVGDHHGA